MEQGDARAPQAQNAGPELERGILLKRISETDDIPAPHPSVLKLMSLFRDDNVEVAQIIQAIERDQSLVARLIKMVNSSVYGLRHTVDSVGKAVTLMGMANVKLLVCSVSTMELFSASERVDWEHSYSSALLMANLLKENDLPGQSTLPLAMILHDIGKVVLRKLCSEQYKLVDAAASKEKSAIFQVECDRLRVCHSEAGAILLEKWDVIEGVVTPILQHHMIDIPGEYVLETALVQFVNWVDCKVRRVPCLPPSASLMDAAGIESVDNDYWLNYQAKLVKMLQHGGAKIRDLGSSSGRLRIKRPANESVEKSRRVGNSAPRRKIPYGAMEAEILCGRYRQGPSPAKAQD